MQEKLKNNSCSYCHYLKRQEYREREIYELQKSCTDLQKKVTNLEIKIAIIKEYVKIGLVIMLGLCVRYVGSLLHIFYKKASFELITDEI